MHNGIVTAGTLDSFAALQRSMSDIIADDAWLEDLELHAMPEDVPVPLRRQRFSEREIRPENTPSK